MADDPNILIEQIFENFIVDDKPIPVVFLRYDGNETTYVTYQQISAGNTLSGDDELLNYVDYYDFDIYSKGDYTDVIANIKQLLKANGFRWQPLLSSGDMYEDDTKYYHKTLNFAIERSN